MYGFFREYGLAGGGVPGAGAESSIVFAVTFGVGTGKSKQKPGASGG